MSAPLTEAAETAMLAAEARHDRPMAAGQVGSGEGAQYVHLVFLLGADVWATACPADTGAGLWSRQVRRVDALIDCPACTEGAQQFVQEVNLEAVERQQRDALARGLLTAFLAWAAEEHPGGGAVLAVYAGSTRLYPMRTDERARAIELWLESTRERPAVD